MKFAYAIFLGLLLAPFDVTARSSDLFICHPWVNLGSGAPCGLNCGRRQFLWIDEKKEWRDTNRNPDFDTPELLMIPSEPMQVHNMGEFVLPKIIKFIEPESKQTHRWVRPKKLLQIKDWYSYEGLDVYNANLEISIDGNYPFTAYMIYRDNGNWIYGGIDKVLQTACAAPHWK